MFADDTTLTVSGKSLHDVEVAINHDLSNVNQWLCANKLSSTKLHLPKPETEYLKKSLSYRGAKLWNSLPNELRVKESLAIFNKNV